MCVYVRVCVRVCVCKITVAPEDNLQCSLGTVDMFDFCLFCFVFSLDAKYGPQQRG